MGAILSRYYAVAKQKGGLTLQFKLAMRTCMSEPSAKEAPDSPENIKLFEDAMNELLRPTSSLPGGAPNSKPR